MMEIRLAKIYDNLPDAEIKVEFLDEITEKKFKEINSAIKEVEELNSLRRLKEFVVSNDKEIFNYLKLTSTNLIEKSSSWNAVKRNDIEIVFNNVNRKLLNYLSSIRTFLDHSETFLKKKFGKESKQVEKFQQITAYFYDSSFAYRFFYKLRNYAQHIGLPISSVSFITEYDRKNNILKGSLSAVFDRDELIDNYNGWSIVKSDLEKLEPKFDLGPILFEMTHNIQEIERNIELIQYSNLLKQSEYLLQITEHLNDGNGIVFIATNIETKENGEFGKYSHIDIPYKTISLIINELNINVSP